MHVLVRFDQCWSESDIEKSARQANLPLASTAPYYVLGTRTNEFMIRFSDIPEAEIDTRVGALARLLG
jgi:DNA-binding transcriptional MocR family regulator